MTTGANVLIGLAVLVLLVWRQTQKRLVREDRRPTILLVLLVLGIVQLVFFFRTVPVSATLILLLAGSVVLAGAFGVWRGHTMRVWREDGQLWRQGTALTLLLWLAAIGTHVGLDFLIEGTGTHGLSTASLLLYLAVSLGAQRVAVQARADRLVRV